MLLPWVGETPILTIEPIDDDPMDENIDILDDEPDANTISSISGKTLIIARDRLYDNPFWVIERGILEILVRLKHLDFRFFRRSVSSVKQIIKLSLNTTPRSFAINTG